MSKHEAAVKIEEEKTRRKRIEEKIWKNKNEHMTKVNIGMIIGGGIVLLILSILTINWN